MTEQKPTDPVAATDHPADARRREAMVKIGRYTAYATPVVLASVAGGAQPAAAAPISGSPPPPAPPPAPPPVPPPAPPPA